MKEGRSVGRMRQLRLVILRQILHRHVASVGASLNQCSCIRHVLIVFFKVDVILLDVDDGLSQQSVCFSYHVWQDLAEVRHEPLLSRPLDSYLLRSSNLLVQ